MICNRCLKRDVLPHHVVCEPCLKEIMQMRKSTMQNFGLVDRMNRPEYKIKCYWCKKFFLKSIMKKGFQYWVCQGCYDKNTVGRRAAERRKANEQKRNSS